MAAERPALRLIPNEEQAMLAETAKKLVEGRGKVARLRELRKPSHPTGYAPELYAEMAELGFPGVGVPEEHGGLGLGLFDLCSVLESLGRELAPEPLLTSALLGAYPLTLAGSEAQKAEHLPAIASGERVITLAYEEPGMRERFFSPAAELSAEGEGFVLKGEKIQVADALVADAFLVTARSAEGLRVALVPASAAGVSITRQSRTDARVVGLVRFEGVAVSREQLLLGDGEAVLRQTLERAAVGLSAEMLGASEKAFADTLAYIKERVQFGVPIGSFQALQHRAASLYCELQLLRSAVYGAARAADEAPEAFPRLAALAKARANQTAINVASEAIQMHGGVGMTDEFDIGFYLKRAQAAAWTFGDTSYHRRRWAELNGY